MAPYNSELIELKKVTELISKLPFMQSYFSHCGDDGVLYKATLDQLATFLAPYITAIGGSGFIATTGTVLPAASAGKFTIVGAGTYTQTTGGSITTTEFLNILGSSATSWSLATAISSNALMSKDFANFGGRFATLADANTAIPNTVVGGKNQRDGKNVLIGSGSNYRAFAWQGGYANEALIPVDYNKGITLKVESSNGAIFNPYSQMGVGKLVAVAVPYNLTDDPLYYTNEFLEWGAETKIGATYVSRVAQYDANFNAITGTFSAPGGGAGAIGIVKNASAVYLRWSVPIAQRFNARATFIDNIEAGSNALRTTDAIKLRVYRTLDNVEVTFNSPSVVWTSGVHKSGSELFYNGQLWKVNTDTVPGDVPGISNKYEALTYPNPNTRTFTLASGAPVQFNSITVDDTNDVYITTYIAAVGFRIYKNNILIKSIANTAYSIGLAAVATYKIGNVLHIIVSNFNAALTDNGATYFAYDVVTDTLSVPAKITTGANEKLTFDNITLFNGVMYSVASVGGIVTGGVLDAAADKKRLDTFKFDSGAWVRVGVNTAYDEIWGARFTKDNGVVNKTLGYQLIPERATLAVDPILNQLVLSFCQNATGSIRYQIFTKTSTDGISWIKEDIDENLRGFYSDVYYDKYGVRKLAIQRFNDSAFTSSLTTYDIITPNDIYSFRTGLSGANVRASIFHKGSTLYVSYRDLVSGSQLLKYTSFTDEEINQATIPQAINYISKVKANSALPLNLKAGDYVITDGSGSFSNFKWFSSYTPLGGFYASPVSVGLGEVCQLIYNGNQFVKRVLTNDQIDALTTIPFVNSPEKNVFISNAFRIPSFTFTENKTIIAGADVRYTSPADYDEIDGAITRSTNGGKTWIDAKVIFKRPVGDGLRIHDLGLTVDRNPASAQYKRIWAFAKLWNANIDSSNTAYWKANTSKSEFYICYSDDDGLTWSTPVKRQDFYIPNSWHASSGASAGITLVNGTLIQPMYWHLNDAGNTNVAGFVYKLPGGDWQIGDLTTGVYANENQIVQRPDGVIVMNARSNNEMRKVLTLASVGAGWVQNTAFETLQDVVGGCAGSFVRYRDTYLFSQPTTYGSAIRNNITVKYSYDLITWKNLVQVSNIASGGYSSLVASDNHFGVAFEPDASGAISYTDLTYLRSILK